MKIAKYKEMPKPDGKSREIAWSEVFRYTNLVKAYNQCRRKKRNNPNPNKREKA